MGFRKVLNYLEQECRHSGGWAADPHLPNRWIGQKFDVSDALPQFIEYGSRAPQ